MTTRRRSLFPLLALIGGLIVAAADETDAAAQKQIEARAKELAPGLTEGTTAFGRPVTDRAAWQRLATHDAFKGIVDRAERLVEEPLPEQPDDLYLDFSRTGNRTRWQRVAARRRGRIGDLVFAECIENQGRFLPAFESLVRELCKEPTWVYPAHDRSLANFRGKTIDVDLASSALGWSLATARWLLGDKLSPDIRALIRDEVTRRVLDSYRDTIAGKRRGNWWMRTTNNWNAVCLAGVTGAALALVEERDERAFFVAAAEHYSANFLRGFSADGYCSEGLGYWNYGFGHYVLLAEEICQASDGRIDLFERPGVREPALFAARIEIVSGVYPAFADCSVRAKPSSRIMAFLNRRFRLGLDRWEDVDTAGPHGRLASALMYSFPNSATEVPPAEEPAVEVGLRSWFEKAGVLIARPAEDSKVRMGVAMKGGHNAEHHNHNDVGSYVVAIGAEPVLADPGSEVYTARTFSGQRYVSQVLNSFGHPVPLVAGQHQQKGGRARGKVLSTEFTDAADTLVLDIASAYEVEGLEKLVRTFRYAREGSGSFTVTDEVAFAEPQAFGTALVTFGDWEETDDGGLVVYGFEEAVRVGVEAEGGTVAYRGDVLEEDVRAPSLPTRIGIDLQQPVRQARITLTVAPFQVADDRRGGSLLRNGGFEHGRWGWRIPRKGMGVITDERAASGKHALKLVDASRTVG
ncbi:MAG: hypothetical protein ACODAJ_10175, partial [Planctomycetota bacterium]